jgi:23S rRNA (cytosine1962-C5)-methyltransferase
VITGQKTGFFIDQRENRKLLQELSAGKEVLNTYCYSGGFSAYALAGGAKRVDSVDSSARAIELCNKNIALNGFSDAQHRGIEMETSRFLEKESGEYDIIVLDPPAFAKSHKSRHRGLSGYKRINSLALKKIKKGGFLFTFSCSQAVDRQLFYDAVRAAAIHAGRACRVVAHLSQPACHPVHIFHPEGEYLKGLVLYAE